MELIQLLVEHKADLNYLGGASTSPLIAAIKLDDVDIVRYLIEHGADTILLMSTSGRLIFILLFLKVVMLLVSCWMQAPR